MLANNELEIQYISDAAATRYAEKAESEGLELVEPVKIIVAVGELYPDIATDNNGAKTNTVLIICLVVLAIVVVAAIVITTVVLVNKKKKAAK